MFFPKLKRGSEGLYSIKKFGSLTLSDKVEAGEFSEMENLSADSYPVMSIREPRGLYSSDTTLYFGGKKITAAADTPMGFLVCTENRVYLDGTELPGSYLGDYVKRRSVVLFGRDVFIVPDGVYIKNTDEGIDISNCAFSMNNMIVTLSYSDENGNEIVPDFTGEFPSSAVSGNTLIITEDGKMYLYQYKGDGWVKQDTVYTRVFFGIDVSAFGTGMSVDITTKEKRFDDGHYTIKRAGDKFLVISACLKSAGKDTGFYISKTIPVLDFAVEHNNRLWGCRYGTDENGNFVNEIYASKQGRPDEWYCFDGLSTDSYAVNLGCAGEFTGAGKLGNEVLFFKEDFIIRVLGSTPSEFSVYTVPARGIQKGHHLSLVNLEERLFYKSTDGITVYDGAVPTVISEKKLLRGFSDTVAGAIDGKYRIAATSPQGERGIFVFDTKTLLWHREDDRYNTRLIFTMGGTLLHLCEMNEKCEYSLFSYRYSADDPLIHIGERVLSSHKEGKVPWYCVTGEAGKEDSVSNKRIRCVKLGLSLGNDSFVRVLIKPDDDSEYRPIFYLDKKTKGVFNATVPIVPCQYFSMRLEGEGFFRLYSADIIFQHQGEVNDFE